MKKRVMEMALLTAATALVLGLSSCKTGMGGVETTDVVAMDDGVMIVDTITMSATVVAKDPAQRKLTLQSNDTGEKKTIKATPEMTNFDKINVGDQVQAVVTEEVAVYIGVGDAPSAATADSVMVSPDGKAGMVAVTSQVTAVVTAVDAAKHKVTLKLPNGTSRKVKVGKDVDLSKVEIGESVTVVVGEGLAISVTTP